MTNRRRVLAGSLVVALGAWGAVAGWLRPAPAWLRLSSGSAAGAVDSPASAQLVATVLEVPDVPLARALDLVATATRDGDAATLASVMEGDGAAAYLAAVALADLRGSDDGARLAALERVAALHIAEPLDRTTVPERWIAIAQLAERTGDVDRAADAYRQALPLPTAVDGWRRTQSDPYRAAAALLNARAYDAALLALDGNSAPSIEAPALRALGRYDEADDAYRRWLSEEPASDVAMLGHAWTAWFQGDLDAAEERFSRVPGPTAWYGLALIANRRGDVAQAADLLVATEDPQRLWLATTLLEREGAWARAIDVYLHLAATSSHLADDAAFRAVVLARRIGDEASVASATTLLPSDSFFVAKNTGIVPLPTVNDLPQPSDAARDALAVVAWLLAMDDVDTAQTVAAFALRDATSEPDVVALGETLGSLGDHTTPARRASTFIAAGTPQLRTWRLAYPRAHASAVLRESKRVDVDPHLVWAVMKKESAFHPGAVSRSGAQGLMQVMPTTWDWLADIQEEDPGEPFDAATNVRYGTTYLAFLLDYFAGDVELTIASYNRGQGYVGRLFDGEEVARDKVELYRAIDAEETREYLQSVYLSYLVYEGLARLEARLP